VKWLSEGWYICHNKQMQLWHVTFATLWLDKVTFLVRGRTIKQKAIRKKGERDCLTYI
jgi:hypothetical protein